MTKREIVLKQLEFIRENATKASIFNGSCVVTDVERDFWLKINEVFADDIKYSRFESWDEEVKDED